ncbi:MAG: hypothetical protein GX802_03600 [Clostridiales bacterium]|nr:hypothetical protein [Clostridiales bacterium]
MKRLTAGVYRVFDGKNDSSVNFLGYSFNIEGTFKRLRHELTLNASANRAMQAAYNAFLEPKMEILEEYCENFITIGNFEYADVNNKAVIESVEIMLNTWVEKYKNAGVEVILVQQEV